MLYNDLRGNVVKSKLGHLQQVNRAIDCKEQVQIVLHFEIGCDCFEKVSKRQDQNNCHWKPPQTVPPHQLPLGNISLFLRIRVQIFQSLSLVCEDVPFFEVIIFAVNLHIKVFCLSTQSVNAVFFENSKDGLCVAIFPKLGSNLACIEIFQELNINVALDQHSIENDEVHYATGKHYNAKHNNLLYDSLAEFVCCFVGSLDHYSVHSFNVFESLKVL